MTTSPQPEAAEPDRLAPALPFAILPAEAADRIGVADLLQASGLPGVTDGYDATTCWVARQSGALVGCAAWERRGDAAVLRGVAVAPDRKGHGIGSALVAAILRQAVAAGIRSMASSVPDADGFLRRFGFVPPMAAAASPAPAKPVDAVTDVAHAGPAGPPPAAGMLLDLRGAALVEPARRTDMPAVLAIYNDAVAESTATYDYEPRSLDVQLTLFDQKAQDGYGFYVARTLDGTIAGFSTYGLYRTRPGWRFACEHSVYVAAPWRGVGLGLALLSPVMRHARRRGFHTMIGVVDAANAASLRMHRRAGFTDVGTIREGGYKFDRWLDVAFLQALL